MLYVFEVIFSLKTKQGLPFQLDSWNERFIFSLGCLFIHWSWGHCRCIFCSNFNKNIRKFSFTTQRTIWAKAETSITTLDSKKIFYWSVLLYHQSESKLLTTYKIGFGWTTCSTWHSAWHTVCDTLYDIESMWRRCYQKVLERHFSRFGVLDADEIDWSTSIWREIKKIISV